MAEVDARPLVRDQVAYLRAAIEEDNAFLQRHSMGNEPDTLEAQLGAMYRAGELRATQVPILVDGRKSMQSDPTRYSIASSRTTPEPTGDKLDERIRRQAAELHPPPQVEVEDVLAEFSNPARRVEYLRGIRDRMDKFESAAMGASADVGIITPEYLALVELVRGETKRARVEAQAEIRSESDSEVDDARAAEGQSAERVVGERGRRPLAPFQIFGNDAPAYSEDFRTAVRRNPSLKSGTYVALARAAGLGHVPEPHRTVLDAIERATGWRAAPRDVRAFVDVLFVAIGKSTPTKPESAR